MNTNSAIDFLNDAETLQADLLTGATVTGAIATPVTEYSDISQLIAFVTENAYKEPVPIKLKDLAVNGQVKAEPMNKYLASKHLPSSGLKEVLKNPASFFYYLNDRSIIFEESKPHFELGTFIHMAILEPKLFAKVKVEPKCNQASLEGCKSLLEFYRKINRKKDLIDFGSMKIADVRALIAEEKAKCKFMMVQQDHKTIIDIVKRNYKMYGGGIIPQIMKGCKIETSFYGADEATGLKVKVRPDAFNIAENIGVNAVISVKTTSSASVEQFMTQAARLQYEVSEGFYLDTISNITGRNFDATILIMLQTVPPFQPAVIWVSPEDLQNGKYRYRYALDLIKECMDKNRYPGFEVLAEEGALGIISAKLPQWSHRLLKPMDIND